MFVIFLLFTVQGLQLNLTNIQQMYYSAPIFIGQSYYNLIVDTGSLIPWINGVNTKRNRYITCENCTSIGKNEIEYGVGKVSGFEYEQYIGIQNQNVSMSILIVDNIYYLSDIIADGILGLSKPKQYRENIISKLYEKNIIDSNEFGLSLDDQNCQSNSLLIFGSPNQTHFLDELHYINSTLDDLWYFEGQSIEIFYQNKKEYLEQNNQLFLLDSGTSKIILPKNKYNKLHNIFNDDFNLNCESKENNQFYELICDYNEIYPDIAFNINNKTYILNFQDYISYCSYTLLLKYKCHLNLQYLDNSNEIILGISFLQKYYTHYDIKNNQIGLGKSTYYNKNKLKINELGNQYDYSVLFYSFAIIIIILLIVKLILKFALNRTISYYQTVLEKSSSRSQEQEMEAINTKTSHIQQTVSI